MRAGRPLTTEATMRRSIERAGFVDVHEKLYRCPIGAWSSHHSSNSRNSHDDHAADMWRDAGIVNTEHWKSGLEGWAMFLLTRYGYPASWSADQVRLFVAGVRRELVGGSGARIYHFS
ncbi:MAG: hypothetical protein M1818_006310 [Claussenomyces sp. TS43310]|nr:MAG: hypothetical protein M1818_006310 [Claussenomyces sp. TS43310]